MVTNITGVLVVAVDYRNFPQGDIEDMMQDVQQSLIWTHKVHIVQGYFLQCLTHFSVEHCKIWW
jgi:hypothetical protein